MLEEKSKTKVITYSLKEQHTRGHCSDPSVLNVETTAFHHLYKYKQGTITRHNVMCQHFTALTASGRKLDASSLRLLSHFKHKDYYRANSTAFCNELSYMRLTVQNAYIYWFYTEFGQSSFTKSEELIVSI
jgi:hypothetical protein